MDQISTETITGDYFENLSLDDFSKPNSVYIDAVKLVNSMNDVIDTVNSASSSLTAALTGQEFDLSSVSIAIQALSAIITKMGGTVKNAPTSTTV